MSAVLYVLGMLTGWCLAVALARLQRCASQGPKPPVPTRTRVLEGPSLLQITAHPAQWVASSKRAAGQQGDRNNGMRNTKLRQITQGEQSWT